MMNFLKKGKVFFGGNFFKSISVLATGSAISMVVLAIQQFLLPHIFTPEELGIKSVILAIPTACIGILCGRYDLTLVYEEEEKNVLPLIKLNVVFNVVASTIVALICAFYFCFIEEGYIKYLYLLPAIFIYLVAYGLTLMLNSYNNRYGEYKVISKMHVYRTCAQSMGTILLGLILVLFLKLNFLSVAILVVPYCVGMLFGVVSQGKRLIAQSHEIATVPNTEIRRVAKKHIKQPLLSAPAIFANGLSYSLITIMMNLLYGEEATGYYSLSIMLLGLPISLISANMSKVYMKDASAEYEKTGRFINTFKKNFLVLCAFAVPVFFAMYFLAPPICAFLFGSEWEIAGRYIKALALMFCFRFVSTALSPGLYICKKQLPELVIQCSFLAATLASGLAAWCFKLSSIKFMWAMGTVRSVVMIINILVVLYYAKMAQKIGGRKDETKKDS